MLVAVEHVEEMRELLESNVLVALGPYERVVVRGPGGPWRCRNGRVGHGAGLTAGRRACNHPVATLGFHDRDHGDAGHGVASGPAGARLTVEQRLDLGH